MAPAIDSVDMGKVSKAALRAALREHMRKLAGAGGRKGGRKGGLTRAANLTAKKRREIARKAAQARWMKARKKRP